MTRASKTGGKTNKAKARKAGPTKGRKAAKAKRGVASKPRSDRPVADLKAELERLTRELEESLQRQTATADVLKVISRSTFDLQAVLTTLVRSALDLCSAPIGTFFLRDGDALHLATQIGCSPELVQHFQSNPIPLNQSSGAGRAFSTGTVVHFPDVLAEPGYRLSEVQRLGGYRSLLAVPLLREQGVIGVFSLSRTEPEPFSLRQIDLVTSFANQAVIAIENARLFNETREALERQAATADILRIISRSVAHAAPVFDTILESCQRLFNPYDAAVYLVEGDRVRGVARRGAGAGDWGADSMPLEGSSTGMAIAQCRPVHFPDLADKVDLPEDKRAILKETGGMTVLYAPIISESRGVGSLVVTRRPKKAFTDTEIEFIQSFADQAAIAIENARLFNETKEALERQTATADILKVIASSPSDVQPVFEAIAERSNRLAGGLSSAVYAIVEDVLHLMAFTRTSPEADAAIQASFPRPLSEATWADHIRKGEIVEIPDAEIEWAGHPVLLKMVRLRGYRCQLFVPLLRDGTTVGMISVTRKQPGTFAPHHVQLLQSFADQAVIAIENVRLFDEVQAKTSDLEESLQQQIATADVLKVISRSAFDLQTVLETLARSAVELSSARRGTVFLRDGDVFRFGAASHPDLNEDWIRFMKDNPQQASRHSTIGRAIASARSVCTPDVDADPEIRMPAYLAGIRAVLAVPLLRDGKVEGVMALSRQEPGEFTARQIELVETFADQAVIAIENTRLINETKQALAYQTGSSNVLRVIASSPTNVEPVLKAIVESARELCEANDAVVLLKDAEHLRFSAHSGPIPVTLDKWPISRNWTAGRSFVDQKPVHVHDMLSEEGAEFPDARAMGQSTGSTIYTVLSVPLLRGNESVGAILLRRTEVRPFNDKQINLLSTFADQAVIAIQNARLFNETREALERQTATAEILKVIASSPDDVQPVFQAIAERSNHLVGGFATTVVSIIDEVVHLSAFTSTTPAADAAIVAFYPRPLSGFSYSDAIRRGETHGIVDIELEPGIQSDQLTMVRQRGWRSALWVPLLLEGKAIGVIGVTRVEPGPFADHHVDMLKTFADQAVIAISNVKLFRQVQERTRELSQSLDDLRTAQDRLVQTEKLASLGQLTAGIAHEIKNPLNFVNNFSALSAELIDEMTDVFQNPALDEAGRRKELDEIRELLKSNLEKIILHGKRADSIVKNMLLHSREGSGEQRTVDINALLDESLNLAYHGARAEKPGFNITLQRDLDPDAGVMELFPQEITRALLNLISNGFYAASKRKAENGEVDFEPVLSAATKNIGSHVEVRIRDNGTGIPPGVKEKMFNPFFTTKPAGEGTGLGLSMSHDIIVKQHGGRIDVETEPGAFTEFIMTLPRNSRKTTGLESE
jgi:two-component system NtrC family sensor kinase